MWLNNSIKPQKPVVNTAIIPKSALLSQKSNDLNHHKKTIFYNKDNIVYDLNVINKTENSITISYFLKPNIKNYTIKITPSEKIIKYESFSESIITNVIKTIDNLNFGTVYKIEIKAIDYFNVETMIIIETKTLQPPIYPRNIHFNHITNSSAVILFTPPPQEIITYRIFVYLDSNNIELLYQRDFQVNQINEYLIDGLLFHTSYYIRIIAINPDGISIPSNNALFMTTQFPDPPSEFIKTGQTIHSIDISFQTPLQYVEYYILDINYTPLLDSELVFLQTIHIPGNTSLPYTISNLYPNTKYNFHLSSYNSDGTSIKISLNDNYTLPIIMEAGFGIITQNSININITNGAYNYFNIQKNIDELTTNIKGNIWTDNNVFPNTLYNYTLIPYNDNPGSSYNIGSKYTYSSGQINPITYNSNYNQLQINWKGIFSTVSIIRNTGGIFTQIDSSLNYPVSNNPSNIVIGYVIDNNLLPNTRYSYNVTLYNGDNIPLIISYDVSSITMAHISQANFGEITSNSIKIQNITGSYHSFQLLRIINNKINIKKITNNVDTSFNDVGLLPNTMYYYQIIPYNDILVVSPTYTIGNIVTRPLFSYASFGDYTAFSINIIQFTGSYNRLQIKRNSNNIDILNNIDLSYNDVGLKPNTFYTYNMIPYNINDLSGIIYNIGSLYTKANGQINPITYIDIDSTKLQINWTGIYSSVSVIRNINGIINPYFSYNYNSSSNSLEQVNGYIIDSSLNPNTNYSYTVTLLNSSSIPTIITTNIQLITPPIINDASFGIITKNSIQINILSGAYDHIMIYRMDGINEIFISTITQNNMIVQGLLSNTSYKYILKPFNIENKEGKSFTIGPNYTLPDITSASFGTTTYNSIQINNISGSYDHIMVYRNDGINEIFISTITQNNMIDLELLPNTSYKYILKPFNIENKEGFSYITDNIYTDSSGNFVNFTNITSSQIQINWVGIDSSAQLIRNRGSSDGIYNIISNTPQTSSNFNIIDSILNPNTSYSYNIYLYNGNNKLTNISSLSTATTLSTISLANYQNITSTTVRIVVPNDNNTYHHIQVYRNAAVIPVGTIVNPDTSFNDTGLIPNNNYSYYLISYNTLNIPSEPVDMGTCKTDSSGRILYATNISTNQI